MRSMNMHSPFFNVALVAVMACPLWLSPAAVAQSAATVEGSARESVKPTDVALTKKGLLTGQVVNAEGKPRENAEVLLYGADGVAIVAATNERGQFAYRGVASGVYYLESGEQVRIARVWNREIAPPSAQQGVLLVSNSDTVRGQTSPPSAANKAVRTVKRVMTNPLAVAGIVATAVAIPVAIHNADSGS